MFFLRSWFTLGTICTSTSTVYFNSFVNRKDLYKDARRQFIWDLRIAIWGITDSGGTQNSVSTEENRQGVLWKKGGSSCRLRQVVYQRFGLEGKYVPYIQLGYQARLIPY